MQPSDPESRTDARPDGNVRAALLGTVYVGSGLALFYGFASGSTELLAVGLLAVLGSVVVSLTIVVRDEGLLTVENGVVGAFVLVSMGLLFALTAYTELPDVVVYGVVIVVGVLVPNRLLERRDWSR